MNSNNHHFRLLLALLSAWLAQFLCVRADFYSYQTRTNRIDDGRHVYTQIDERQLEPGAGSLAPWRSVQRTKGVSGDLIGAFQRRRQIMSNQIGPLDPLDFQFFRRTGRKLPASRARTVESPALSVDSGGRSSGTSVANELAKLFNVKQGFYADLYDRIDRPDLSTRRPSADALEDAMRSAVQQMLIDRERDNSPAPPSALPTSSNSAGSKRKS